MKNKKLATKELVWYIIGGFFAVSGIILSIFSLVGDYLNVPAVDNWIVNAETSVSNWMKINLDWLGWGTIFFALGLTIGVITLLYFAKKVITEKEKALRRAQRLGADTPSN